MTPKPEHLRTIAPSHELTATPHVWRDCSTGRFTCEDETNDFFGDFATEQEAADALKDYVKHILG